MKKSLTLVALGFFLAAPSLRAAELKSVRGSAQVQRAGAQSWAAAKSGSRVKDGDTVKTGPGSQTDILLPQGHRLLVRERTTLKIDSSNPDDMRLSLAAGRVRAFVAKLRKRNKFEMRTPVAVASVRGTVFELEVGEDQSSRLSVLEGSVNYRDLAGLGSDVLVLQGNSVLIEPGAAPRAPEPLPADMSEGLMPDREDLQARFDLKAEVARETGLQAFKDYFQTDAAQEMKTAQYQEGKTLIDAFGHRVRLEEYITRPAPEQFSFVALNTREDRFDFTRFDLYAAKPLPEDLGSVNLFRQPGSGPMDNWAVKTHRLSSNGGDYYREWQDGGAPVPMTGTDGPYKQVVFNDWFVEVRGAGSEPTLLSHWQPHPDFKSGLNPDVNATRDKNDRDLDGSQDIPSGYEDFLSGGAGTVGDDRPIDLAGFSAADRLKAFDMPAVASAYALSEGYRRESVAVLDGLTLAEIRARFPDGNDRVRFILHSTEFGNQSVYKRAEVTGGSDITVRNNTYYISDEGRRLNAGQASTIGSRLDGLNLQDVFTSPTLMGGRKIDVVISPGIFRRANLLD
ncbi:MAG: FecR family protein [Elusimicrobiota bacterium]